MHEREPACTHTHLVVCHCACTCAQSQTSACVAASTISMHAQRRHFAAGITYSCQTSLAPTGCTATCGDAGVRTTTRTCMSPLWEPVASSFCSNCVSSTSPCPAVPACAHHVHMHTCVQQICTDTDTCTSEHLYARTHSRDTHLCVCTHTQSQTPACVAASTVSMLGGDIFPQAPPTPVKFQPQQDAPPPAAMLVFAPPLERA